MTSERKCLKCQGILPADAPEGLCPSCLLQQAMATLPDKTLLLSKQMATQTIRSHDVPPESPAQPRVKLRRVGAADSPDAECDFQLLSMLGQGGMGLVYQARQTSISRSIALKMMRSAKSDDQDRQALFLAEALVTGQLDHPNIVPIYDLGMDEAGHLFYAMKELKGRPWSDSIGHATLQENLDVLLRVGDAVAFAHSRGVIHRDLKPQNVMLGDYGEVVLMDWGLAAAITTGTPALRVSQSTALCGTPAYMAPEMANGLWNRIGPQSDIYLLGAILFEILEGAPPHLMGNDDATDALTAARLNKIADFKTPGELQDIARKAMATEPADRFASVKDFQAAIRVFREHQESDRLAVLARQRFEAALASKRYDDYAESVFGYRQALRLWPDNPAAQQGLNQASLQYARTALDQGDLDLALSLLKEEDETQRKLAQKVRQRLEERTRQTARIRALRRSLAGAGATLLVVAAASAIWINRERLRAVRGEQVAQQERLRAVRGEQAAETALAESRRHLSESLEAAGVEHATRGRNAEALALLAAALRQDPSNHVAASRALDLMNRKDWALPVSGSADLARPDGPFAGPLPPAPFPRRQVAVRPIDRRSVVLQIETTDAPPVPLGAPIGPLPCPSTASRQATVSPDGRYVAFASGNRQLYIHDRFKNTQPYPPLDLPGSTVTLEFSPTGDLLALGFRSGLFRFLDVGSGVFLPRNLLGPAEHLGTFTRDRTFFSMASRFAPRSEVCLADLRPGNAHVLRFKPGGHIDTARFTPDGRGIILAGGYGAVGVYSHETGELRAGPVRLSGPCRMSVISPDGLRCASSTANGEIVLWSLATGDEIARVMGHTGPISALAFDPHDRLLATGSDDRQIRLWDSRTLAQVTNLPVGDTVRCLAMTPDSTQLVAGVGHDALRWNLAQPGTPPEVIGRGGWVRAVDMHSNGRLALWADYSRGHVFDLVAGTNLAESGTHEDAIWRAKFNPDGQSFATVSFDGFLRLWSLDGTPLTSFLQIHDGETGGSSTLTYSRDGRWVAAGAGTGLVRIWDTATGREIVEPLRAASDQISAIDISADKLRILIASWDGTAIIQELIPCEEPLPWLPDLAEAVGGLRSTGSGFDPLTWSNRTEILASILPLAEAPAGDSLPVAWLRWFLADRGTRTAGPWSSVTVEETAGRLLKSSAADDIAAAVALAPGNPTGCLRMAEAVLPFDTVRAAYWTALARELDPATTLSPHLEAILAQAPFDAADPPGPEVVHLNLVEDLDFSPYAYREVVLHGTPSAFAPDHGQGKLWFEHAGTNFFGFIRKRNVAAIEKSLGGNIQEKLCGRPIRLKGVLTPLEGAWEIQIVNPSQIQIADSSPASDG